MNTERNEDDAVIVSGRRLMPSPETERRILAALLRIEDRINLLTVAPAPAEPESAPPPVAQEPPAPAAVLADVVKVVAESPKRRRGR